MNKTELEEIIKSIKPADRQAIIQAKSRQAQLAKPPGSLGKPGWLLCAPDGKGS